MWRYQVPPSPEELFHHGVKGMKWGVRKDRKYGSAGSMAVRAVLTALNAFDVPAGLIADLGMQAYTKARAKGEDKRLVETKYDLAQKKGDATPEQDAKQINPFYVGYGGRANNCSNCSMAYELRRRGFDVQSKPLYGGRLQGDITKAFGNPEVKSVSTAFPPNKKDLRFLGSNSYMHDNAVSELSKYGDGARGTIMLNFRDTGMGHIFNWEVSGGSAKFIDAQDPSRNRNMKKMFRDVAPASVRYFRTDNAQINYSLVGNFVENKKRKQ